MKNLLKYFSLIAVLGFPLFGMDIMYAPIHIYRDDLVEDNLAKEKIFSSQLLEQIQLRDTRKVLSFTQGAEPIRSILQAAEQATKYNKELVIYSKLLKSKDAYELELTVYDDSQKMVLKKFFTKYEIAESDSLIQECAKRVMEFLYDKLGINDIPIKKYWDGVGLSVNGFWILAVDGNTKVMMDYAGGGFEFFFQPELWWLDQKSFMLFVRWGIGAQYHYAESLPAVQPFQDHVITALLPWTLGFAWDQQEVSLSLVPGVRVDIADQKPVYADSKITTTAVVYAAARLTWQFWLDKNRQFGIGIQDQFGCSFYTTPFWENQIGLVLSIGFK